MTKAKILIVEDEINIARLVEGHCQHQGGQTKIASDSLVGWKLYEESEPDLVILDLFFPGIDGKELCRRMSAQRRTLILMLTALLDEVDRGLSPQTLN